MVRWLSSALIISVCAAATSAAAAVMPESQSFPRSENGTRSLKLRLIEEPRIGPKPIHNSGMIAQTQVSRNAAIGIGLFKSSQRKPDAGEFRLEGRSPNSRKAAVRFLLKF